MKNQDNKHIRKSKSTKISIVITSIIAILLFIVIGYLIYYYFIPKPKQYKLYIKNPNLIEAEVYIDGKFTGNLIKNDLVKFKKPQNFILKIKDLEAKYEEYIAEIVLNDDHNKLTIDYSPSLIPKPLIAVKEQFILSINNMTEIDPDLFINNENIGKLSNNIRKIYTKPQNLVLKFEDETGKYKEIESIIELNDENNDATFDYNPPKIPQQQIVKKLKKDKVVEKPKEKKIVVKPEEENFELVINNKVDIDPEVFIDNISKGFLSQKSKFLYTEPQNFSLKIEAGLKVGIVGVSGSGKTTLANLLLRNHDVKKGSIELDNHDIRDITRDSLREQIAFVPQDVSLFHRPIMDNIRYCPSNRFFSC